MIHTFTIKIQITGREFGEFLKKKSVKCSRKQNKGEDKTLEGHGMILTAYKYYVREEFDYYCYELFVNPSHVMGNYSPLSVYIPEQFQQFYNCFNELIKEYNLDLPTLEYWTAYRIDFTKDIYTPYVDLYIKLFQKADLSKYKFALDKNKHHTRFRKGSLYCKCKNHHINFYNKADKLKKDKASLELIEQAHNILRIEVQCKKKKLDSIKYKYNLDNKLIIHFLTNYVIAADILTYYTSKVLGVSDYLKRNKAITKIKKSTFQPNTKEIMINIINDIAKQYSSIDKIKQNYNNLYLNQFKQLGINLVTIDPNTKGISQLTSIIELIAQA